MWPIQLERRSCKASCEQNDDVDKCQQTLAALRIIMPGLYLRVLAAYCFCSIPVKHSAATEATFRARRQEYNVEIVIQDNGRGFSPESVAASRAHGSGFGLPGILERARIPGGRLQIQSAPDCVGSIY